MEDKPAGKNTPSNPPVDSPKKVYNPIASQSQWSLGWNNGGKDIFNKPNSSKGFNAYHNQRKNNDWKKEEPIKPKKTVGSDKPVWNYDPKTAGKTTMILGTDKPDYRKKDEVYKERTPTTLTNSRKK